MRTFEHFPQTGTVCPICGTNDDKPCILVPIDGTYDDGKMEAQPAHAACMGEHGDEFSFNRDAGVVYLVAKGVKA